MLLSESYYIQPLALMKASLHGVLHQFIDGDMFRRSRPFHFRQKRGRNLRVQVFFGSMIVPPRLRLAPRNTAGRGE